MAIEIKELWHRVLQSDKKLKAALALGLVGILLLTLSEALPKKSARDSQKSEMTYTEYARTLEEKTCEIISAIDGVGECRVMLTLKTSNENIFAKNTEENSSSGHYSFDSEYVLYDGENGESPVLLKEYLPEVLGVAVVCSGADSDAVRENVIHCVSSLFSIPSNKISVSKLKR
ncbi:MAG: hypothetical protein E7520_06785 [Ruminococcaceae bacterium]|nr:hypothetical protein [Oscillospiraceae bacterium]